MARLVDHAVERLRSLPPDRQDEIASVLLQLAGDEQPSIALTAAEESSFDRSLAQAARGEFATPDEVAAIWMKHGP